MINKPLDKIDRNDLEQLLNTVLESKTIEYKRQLPTPAYDGRKEFLADISSFANTSGGDLIYGIEEENGCPKSIDGVEIDNIDEEVRKYENIIRDGIEPRVNFETRPVNISDKKFVLVFRVKKSWIGPHRVIYQGHDKFYSRNTKGKYPLDTSELRTAFNFSHTIIEQISKFKTERIIQVIANNFPVPLSEGAKIVLHLIPLESFSPGYKVDLTSIINNPIKLKLIYLGDINARINLEGVLSYGTDGYAQYYRSGIIEAVEGCLLNRGDGKKYIPSGLYEKELIKSLTEYLSLAKELGVNMPIVVFLTFIGVQGYEMPTGSEFVRFERSEKIDRDILQLPETIIESYDTKSADMLRPLFDLVWNACGYPGSRNFDEDGNWIGK